MRKLVFLLLLIPIMTACPKRNKSDLKRIQENNWDLPDLKDQSYHAIKFKLSDVFVESFRNSFAITRDDAMIREIKEIDVFFSVERFSNSQIDNLKTYFDSSPSDHDAVHDYYLEERCENLKSHERSIKREIKNLKYPTYIETIVSNDSYRPISYFIASMQVGNECYVFQFIGSYECMGYLYDDFMDLLTSVN